MPDDDPVDHLNDLIDQFSAAAQEAAPQAAAAEGDTDPPLYTHLDEWIHHWLADTIERRTATDDRSGINWCASWWAHPEALNRLYALWREWEKARQADTMSAWWRDHFDPHLRELIGDNGPFHRCHPHKHRPAELIPVTPMDPLVAATLPEGPPPADQ